MPGPPPVDAIAAPDSRPLVIGLAPAAPKTARWRTMARGALRALHPKRLLAGLWRIARDYYADNEPTTLVLYTPLLLLAVVLFTRAPWTNYIFDEQEALLANPLVNRVDGLGFTDIIHRDFWGLPPTASIGSYRPIPSALWFLLWGVSKHPFFHHLYNIVLHALGGAMLGGFAWSVSRRKDVAWLTALTFTGSAVLTEAVSGIVGIADVLGGLGAIAALMALRLPGWSMPLGVFAGVLFSLFSKESGLVCVPLVPFAALLTAHALHPQRPARLWRALLAFVAAAGAFVLYVELRKAWFPAPLPELLTQPLPPEATRLQQVYRELLVWFQQAPLPNDPINNPLVHADFPHRVAGALRVYWRGLGQVVFPLVLSGDYSFPQEPVPESLLGWETVAGAAMVVGPVGLGLALLVVGWRRERRWRTSISGGAQLPSSEPLPTGAPLAAVPGAELAARRWRRRYLELGLIVTVAAITALATEWVLVRRGAPGWVRTWPWSLAGLLVGIGLLIDGWRSPAGAWRFGKDRPLSYLGPILVALGAMWVVVSYFPHSNIPVLLPTVRAERFWYYPVIGSSLAIGYGLAWLLAARSTRPASSLAVGGRRPWRQLDWKRTAAVVATTAFVGFQLVQSYRHAMDYRDDLVFWAATKDAVPRSAKAHLNYSVMKGARKDLETRLVHSLEAARLAPDWPMAHVYTGDTLCRMHRPDEAWPYYEHGFDIGPNERALISLGLQCLWDEKRVTTYEKELRALAEKHPGSWIAYLAIDVIDNGETHEGVDPKYRPRGYNEGPKKE